MFNYSQILFGSGVKFHFLLLPLHSLYSNIFTSIVRLFKKKLFAPHCRDIIRKKVNKRLTEMTQADVSNILLMRSTVHRFSVDGQRLENT